MMRSERRIRNNKLRRQRQLRGYFLFTIFSFCLVIIFSVSCFGIWSKAKDSNEATLYKYYTSIEVQYGDTLWEIASEHYNAPYEDYNDYIREVMEINSLADTDIAAGSYLIIPYYSTEFKE